MSFLTPLYIAGLLAVSLPLLFHLIRRTPRGQLPFSSLMFLSPSPPRLTRRSRLDNLLLLLLRAAVLVLLALAFARPFLRESARFAFDQVEGRRVALLVDTSASMRRAGLWQQALAEVDVVLDDLAAGDDVALFTFDEDVTAQTAFDDSVPLDPRQRVAAVRAQLGGLAPTWGRSNLAEALIAVAEELHQLDDSNRVDTDLIRRIVLVTDFHQGSRLDALETYRWPDDVNIELRRLLPELPSNAGLHLAADSPEHEPDSEPQLVVRVDNSHGSITERFELHWATGPPEAGADDPIDVTVPPGESRVVRVPRAVGGSTPERLVLSGDDHPFDNTLHLVAVKQEEIPLAYVGGDKADDAESLHYYLAKAFPHTPRRKVNLAVIEPDDVADLDHTRLIVVGRALDRSETDRLRKYVEDGGTILYVLADTAAGDSLVGLTGLEELTVLEASVDDYAMLGEIRFSHPVLSVFADPRFNDFTKIHFWRHRRLDFGTSPGADVLARFDDGDPALVEWALGRGRLLVLTAGWHPADSQLARSSKFVPLLAGILQRAGVADAVAPQYLVGDSVSIFERRGDTTPGSVSKPDAAELQLAAGADRFDETDLPGVYHLQAGELQEQFAVNLAPEESRTALLEPGELEELGVRLGRQPTRAELVDRRRQMRDLELESRQKLWRWLIAAALGIIIVETWLAGRLSRPAAEQPEVAG